MTGDFDKLKRIRVNFVNHGKGFDKNNNYYIDVLSEKYEVEVSDNPDILFICLNKYKQDQFKYNGCIKVLDAGTEAVFPNYNEIDYAIGPLSFQYKDRYCQIHDNNVSTEINNRESCYDKKLFARSFCNFIYMNGKDGYGAVYRQNFCKELMKYKNVDCLGRVLHNTDGTAGLSARYVQNWNDSKRNILKNYKFTIAFENQPIEGYFTEKIIDPFMAHSVPIYWGDPTVTDRFNKESFINANGREIEDVIEEIKFYDKNEDAYMKMLQCKPLMDLSIIEDIDKKKKQFIEMIAEKGTRVVLQDGGVISDYPSQNIRKHPALFPFFTDVINWKLHYLYGSIKHKAFFGIEKRRTD